MIGACNAVTASLSRLPKSRFQTNTADKGGWGGGGLESQGGEVVVVVGAKSQTVDQEQGKKEQKGNLGLDDKRRGVGNATGQTSPPPVCSACTLTCTLTRMLTRHAFLQPDLKAG